jgi:ligand-binding SRPBCC domain-containing protein
MPTLVFESTIGASPDAVYAWHARPGAFAALTPWWALARIAREAPSLAPGARAEIRVGPGPLALPWLAEHTVNDPPHQFVERQLRGPFARWEHRHRFLDIPDRPGLTRLRDEVRYALPLGPLGALADALVVRPFLRRLFAYRHRVTRTRLTCSGRREPGEREAA